MKKITFLFALLVTFMTWQVNAQSVSATYSAGDIPTQIGFYDSTCNGAATPLVVTIPVGSWVVTSVDVVYDMTAQGGGWMSEQRSQIACQETGLDEGGFISGAGYSGTYNYSRTDLDIANGPSTGGDLTFEIQAYRTWGSTGDCGTNYQYVNNSTWTVTVNYIQVIGEPPAISCPEDAVADSEPGVCGAAVSFGDAVAVDPEDGVLTTTQTAGPLSGDLFPVGDTVVTFSVTDSDNNTVTCDFTVTVTDVEDPVALCQDLTVELDVSGYANITPADIDAGSSDNCDFTLSVSQSSFSCSDVGENTVTLTVTDDSGLTATCDATVTVEDNQAPVVICKGSGGAFSILEDFEATSIPGGWSTVIEVGADDWQFGVGMYPYDLIPLSSNVALFDDDAAGSGTVNFVRLLTPIYNLNGADSAILSFDYTFLEWGDQEFYIEVFDGANWVEILMVDESMTEVLNTGDIDVLTYANPNFQVRFSYDDLGGWGYAPVVDNFMLDYNIPPTDPLEVVLDADGTVTVDKTDLLFSVDDNCGYSVGGITFVDISNPRDENLPQGLGTIETFMIANDFELSGNEEFTMTQMEFDFYLGGAGPIQTVDVYFFEDDNGSPGAEIGNELGITPTSTTWFVTNANSQDGYEVVLDITPFVFASPATYWVGVLADVSGTWTGLGTTQVSMAGSPLMYSADGGASFVVFDPGYDGVYTYHGTTGSAEYTFDCSNLGENSVDVTVVDAGGNEVTCTATVIVTDETAPVVVCGSSVTVELDENGEYTVMPEDVTTTLEDSCGLDVVLLDLDGYTDTTVTCADIGLDIQATLFVNDASGNFASCQTTITVVDTMAPELTCPDASYETEPSNNDGVYVVRDYYGIGAATYSDNCTDMSTLVVTQDPAPGTQWGINSTGNPGPYVVTFTVEDESGNVATCTLDVTVINGIGVTENTLLDNALGMYPNPATDMVKLVNTSDIALESAMIYDINGKLVTELDLNNMGTETTFDVSQFANGVYMVKIIGENASTVKRLIKE